MNNEDATLVYSILDYPERIAKTGLTEQEIKALLDRYSVIGDFAFTFIGRPRDKQ